MAIQSRKISSFPNLSSISGNEVVMVAYKGKSYKMPLNLLTGNAIQSLTQKISQGDRANNPITLVVGTGEDAVTYTFNVYNGAQGSKGPDGDQGKKGLKGDTAVALYNVDLDDQIIKSIEDLNTATEEQLAEMIVSANIGYELFQKVNELEEEYLESQDVYDEMLAKGLIKDNVKYFIFEG